MKKKFSLILLAVLLVLVMATCVACGDPDEPTVPDTPAGPTTYTVTIDLQDGSTPTTQTVEEGGTVTFPSVSNTQYKTFRGWFKNADGTGPWSKNTAVTEDVTIYACWNPVVGKVTFLDNHPDAGKATVLNAPKGEALDLTMYVPERNCYIFAGWYLDAECTQAYDTTSIFTGSLTLYAAWTLDPDHEHSYDKETIAVTCETDGYDLYTCECGDNYKENVIPALNHKYTFDDNDYFGMVTCENEGCSMAARKASLRIYEDDFVYNFDEDKAAEINARYQSMLDILASVDKYDAALHAYEKPSALWDENKAFEEIYNAFYDDLMYLIEQYQYSYVFYCVDDNETNTAAHEAVDEFRTEKVSDFYALYRLIYETKFREYFFDKHEGGWTDEDIEQALTMSDSYGGEEYVAINNRISEIEIEFRDITNQDKSERVLELYEEFVSLNNQIAELAGYENYIEYAYENVYSRDYSPADVATMRNYVKTHLKNVYTEIYTGYSTYRAKFDKDSLEESYYNALMKDSVFTSKLGTDIVKGYFSIMNSSAGEQDIDFLYHANELFKNGNYYTGKYEGAFNYWIPAQETSILYFGPKSYSASFTFVHEFGHYYNGVYNQGISMSYDLEETHSQADEMMFLSYLEDALPKDILRKIYPSIYYDNLFNMFAIIMLATAVDEFEYCVYTSTAPDGTPATYTANDYDKLFNRIMNSYGIAGTLNSSYWRYVVIEAPCYYISYAMSALPCVELLSIAETEGFAVAQAKYFKFFTFTDDPANVEVDEYGDRVIKIGYGDTLEYIGMDSIFSEDLYTTLSAYFCDTDKDFTYPDAE